MIKKFKHNCSGGMQDRIHLYNRMVAELWSSLHGIEDHSLTKVEIKIEVSPQK